MLFFVLFLLFIFSFVPLLAVYGSVLVNVSLCVCVCLERYTFESAYLYDG